MYVDGGAGTIGVKVPCTPTHLVATPLVHADATTTPATTTPATATAHSTRTPSTAPAAQTTQAAPAATALSPHPPPPLPQPPPPCSGCHFSTLHAGSRCRRSRDARRYDHVGCDGGGWSTLAPSAISVCGPPSMSVIASQIGGMKRAHGLSH